MNKILCSTGALIAKPNGRDYRLLKDLSKKLFCDGYEFMMYSSWYGETEEIAEFLRDAGLSVPVMHLWDGMISDQNFANQLCAYPKLDAIAGRYGIEILTENVVCNKEDPMTHWCELKKEYPDIRFIFDTKMAAFHEQLPLIYEKEYDWLWTGGHIRHLHVNDYGGGYMDWANRYRILLQ